MYCQCISYAYAYVSEEFRNTESHNLKIAKIQHLFIYLAWNFVFVGFLLKTSSPTNPYTKNIGFLNLANVKVFKNCFLLYYSQCLCFVAGCLLLLAFKCKKTMKKNKREEQQERRRKNKKRTHIYEEQQQKQRQSMSQKQRERQENVKNNTQQE